jgi:hypothetical protein
MRDIWEITSSGLLTKQAMRKTIFIIYKNMYILKTLLNTVTTGNEAFDVLGNKILYACFKEVCRL